MSVEQGEFKFGQQSELEVVNLSFEEKREQIAQQYGVIGEAVNKITEGPSGEWLYDGDPIAEAIERLNKLDEKEEDSYMRGQI